MTVEPNVSPGAVKAISPTTLVEVFYGLAIGSGIEHVGERLFGHDAVDLWLVVPLSIGAFAVAIGDWLIYYAVISENRYKGVARLVFDILIVTTIFVVFEATESATAFVWTLTVYFVFGTLYYLVLQGEVPLDPESRWLFVAQFLASLLALGLGCAILLGVPAASAAYIAAVLGVIWGVVNLRSVSKAFRQRESTA